MVDIKQVSEVNITRQTTPVTRASFGLGMFLGAHKRFNERVQLFSSVQAMLDSGFTSTDKEVIAAQKYFGQAVSPTGLYIGRRAAVDTVTLTFSAATAAGQVFSIKINGNLATYVSVGVETAAAVAAAFEAANAAVFVTAGVTFDDAAADGTAVVNPTVASTAYSLTEETNISFAATYTETLTDAFAAIQGENNTFYGVMSYSHVKADILEMAAAVEATKKLYVTSSSESTVFDTSAASDTTSVAAQLEAAAYDRTMLVPTGNSDTEYPEAAAMGKMFPKDPGSATWHLKQLAGITRDNLTDTQFQNVLDKSANPVVQIGGVNVLFGGTVASGEYTDVIRGIDWLEARLSERIFSILSNNDKVGYTDRGIAQLQEAVEAQKTAAINAGLLDEDLSLHTITAISKANTDFNDRANRIYTGLKFTFTLAGAIHKTVINGVVTL